MENGRGRRRRAEPAAPEKGGGQDGGWLVRLGLKPAGGYRRLVEAEQRPGKAKAPAEHAPAEDAAEYAAEEPAVTTAPAAEVSPPPATRPRAVRGRAPSGGAASNDGWLVRLGLKPAGGYVGLAEAERGD